MRMALPVYGSGGWKSEQFPELTVLFAGAGTKVVEGMESVFVCDAAVPELHRMLT